MCVSVGNEQRSGWVACASSEKTCRYHGNPCDRLYSCGKVLLVHRCSEPGFGCANPSVAEEESCTSPLFQVDVSRVNLQQDSKSGLKRGWKMRLTVHAAVLSVSAAAGQAGSAEWARRRGGGAAGNELAFVGGGAAGHLERGAGLLLTHRLQSPQLGRAGTRGVRRQRPQQAPSMQFDESMDQKRRSVTRGLFSDNQKEISSWMKTLKSLDGPEMPFDEMCDMIDKGDAMLRVSRESREKKMRRYKHFDLRRNPSLLTRTEEVELGRKVQEMLRWERVRSFLQVRLGRPPTMEEWAEELAELDGAEGLERRLRDMKAARERMISCNLRLVLHIARRKFYTGKSGNLKVGLEDMIQDGTAGLVKAVERFDPEKGFRFSTYATWWVHQGIHCGFADCGRVIRLPMNLHTMVCKVARLQTAMVDQLGRQPTVEELALESGLAPKKVEKCLRVNKVEPISLDGHSGLNAKPKGVGTNLESYTRERLGDSVLSLQEPEPVDGADVSLLKTDVETILGDLSAREAYVLKMRFGLGGSSPSTLETVGRQLHVTRERVRQIQLAAIEKLRGRTPTHGVLYADRATDGEQVGSLPSAVLIGLVKQALEPRQDEMSAGDRRIVNGARRRVEATQGEGRPEEKDARDRGTKGRGFVMKRPYTQRRPRVGESREGVREGRDASGSQAQAHAVPPAPPPAMRTTTWQPSLQAA
ncbi:unnamed protein product [Scytosiphon promiscuus]